MAFFLTLVYIVLLYLRPLDLNPGYAGVPLMMVLGVVNLILTLSIWFVTGVRRRNSLSPMQIWMTAFFVFLAVFSWLKILLIIDAKIALLELQPMLGAFFMVVLLVSSAVRR